jgi:hypothetical protein
VSAHYEITIIAAAGGRVVAQFEVVSPDVEGIVASEDIALQLIIEAWEELASSNAPLSVLEAHPRSERLFGWRALQCPREAISDQAHQAETTQGAKPPVHPRWGEVSGYQSDDDGCVRLYDPQYDEFYAEALVAITGIGFHSYVEATDEDPTVAVMVFEVDDPELVSHLVPGLRWTSSMYDYESWLS